MKANTHLDDDQLVGLSLELYTRDEESRLLAHVTACGRCARALRAQLVDLERLRARRRATLARPTRPRVPRRWLAPGLAAAAALLLMMVRPAPVDPGWMELPPALVTRSVAGDDTAELMAALQPYRDRDARAAVRSLRALQLDGTEALVRDTYLASALAQSGDDEGARALLLRLLDDGRLPQPWREQCEELAARLGMAR